MEHSVNKGYDPESKDSLSISLFLAALVLMGSVFRLYNLNALGFVYDESIQAAAVKGILTHGYPVLESGIVYIRALPFLYLEALSALLLGWSESSLRLPSAIFNLATIPLIYLFTRDLLGKKTALVAATILTFSLWEIEFSRVARMYTAFQFFYLLSLYVFYKGFIQNHREYRYATFPIFFLTFTIHKLSFPLAISFLFPLMMHNPPTLSKVRSLLYTAASGAFYLFYWHYIEKIFPRNDVAISQNVWASIYQKIEAFVVVPSLTFFDQLSQSHPILLWLILGLFLITVIFSYRSYLDEKSIRPFLLNLSIATSCFFHQIGLAAVLLLGFILVDGDAKKLTHKFTLAPLGLILASFLAWFAYALYDPSWYLSEGGPTSLVWRTLSLLIDYPRLYDKHIHFLIQGWLTFAIWTFTGLGFLIIHYFQKRTPQTLYIAGMCYLLPIILISFIGENWDKPRYFFHLYSVMIILFAYMSVKTSDFLIHLLRGLESSLGHKVWLSTSVALVLSLLLNADFGIVEPVEVSQRTYTRNNVTDLRSLNRQRPFEVDYRTCSQQVKTHIKESDIIISFGPPVTRHIYTGRVDYFVKRRAGSPVNAYTGSIHLSSLEALSGVLEEADGRRVWVLGDECASVPNWYTSDMCEYLQSIGPYAVCRGEDARAAAYLLNPQEAQSSATF